MAQDHHNQTLMQIVRRIGAIEVKRRDAVQARSRYLRAKKAASAPSILGVIDNAGGGKQLTSSDAMRLSAKEIEAFALEVNAFYDTWTPPKPSGDLVVHPGGIFGGIGPNGEPAVANILAALLYYPHALVHDPLSAWFSRDKDLLSFKELPEDLGPNELYPDFAEFSDGVNGFWNRRQPLEEMRLGLSQILRVIETVRPLLEAGVLIPVPQWKIVRQQQDLIGEAIEQDLLNDELAEFLAANGASVADGRVAGPATMTPIRPSVLRRANIVPASYYTNRLIAVSNALRATYVPGSRNDMLVMRHCVQRATNRLESATQPMVIPELVKVRIPAFANLKPATLVSIRQNADAFQDFRMGLQSLFAAALSLPDPDAYPDQTSKYIEDALAEQVRGVESALRKSAVLRRAGREGAKELVLGVAGSSAAVALTSISSLPATAALAAGSVAATSIAAMILEMITRPKMDGAKLVISGLIEGAK